MCDVTLLIVNYNAGEHLAACLESLRSHCQSRTWEVILVDNHSTDGSLEAMAHAKTAKPQRKGKEGEAEDDLWDEVRIIRNDRNLGFGAACNQGLELAQGEYVFLVNPDVRFTEDTLAHLANFLDGHPEADAVGPRLLNSDGSLQPSRGKFPTLYSSAALAWGLKRLMPGDEAVMRRLPLMGRLFAQYRPVDGPQRVDYLTGACLMARREAMEAIGGFDERFFLYYDEIDLCTRLGAVWYLPETTASHAVAACSGSDPCLPALDRRISMLAYFRKHGSPWQVLGIRAILALEWLLSHLWPPARGRTLSVYRVHLLGLARRGQ